MLPQIYPDIWSTPSSEWSLPAPSDVPQREFGYIDPFPFLDSLTSAGTEGDDRSHVTSYDDFSLSLLFSPRPDADVSHMQYPSIDKASHTRPEPLTVNTPRAHEYRPREHLPPSPTLSELAELDQFMNWSGSPDNEDHSTPHWVDVPREPSVERFDDTNNPSLEPVVSEQDSHTVDENVLEEASPSVGTSKAAEPQSKQYYTEVRNKNGILQYKCLYVQNYGPESERKECASLLKILTTPQDQKTGSNAGRRAKAISEDGETRHERNWHRHFSTNHAANEYKAILMGKLDPDDAVALQHPETSLQRAECDGDDCWYEKKLKKSWRLKCWGRTERMVKEHRATCHGKGIPPVDWVPPATLESEDEFADLKVKYAQAKKEGRTLAVESSKEAPKRRKPRKPATAKAAAKPRKRASTSSQGSLPVAQPDSHSVPPPPPRSGTKTGKRKRVETVDLETAASTPSQRKRTKYSR